MRSTELTGVATRPAMHMCAYCSRELSKFAPLCLLSAPMVQRGSWLGPKSRQRYMRVQKQGVAVSICDFFRHAAPVPMVAKGLCCNSSPSLHVASTAETGAA